MRTIKVALTVIPASGSYREIREYRVLVVKNSTEFSPGQVLERRVVDALCADKRWDVTIVPQQTGGAK